MRRRRRSRQFEHDHGLDRPVVVQYAAWLDGICFCTAISGRSFITGRPVGPDIAADAAGDAGTRCRGLRVFLRPVDRRRHLIGFAARLPWWITASAWSRWLGVSIPGFWLALVLIMALAVDRDWFPPGGVAPWSAGFAAHLNSIVLPTFCLAIFYMAVLSRMTRSSMLEVLDRTTCAPRGRPACRGGACWSTR